MSIGNECVIAIDVDGTIIPLNIDFEVLRSRIRELIGVNHPLRPLGESLAKLPISDELRRRAWELIEGEELKSIELLDLSEVKVNADLLRELRTMGVKAVLVTMRNRKTLIPLLLKLGLMEYADTAVTRDSHPSRRRQLEFIKTLNSGARLVFLGDTAQDEEVAVSLGINFIRVKDYRELPEAILKALKSCASNE